MNDAGADESQRIIAGRVLCYGSVILAAAVTVALVALSWTRMLGPGHWVAVPVYGNTVLAAAGAAAGAVYGRGRPGRQLLTGTIAAAAGAACYWTLILIGTICLAAFRLR